MAKAKMHRAPTDLLPDLLQLAARIDTRGRLPEELDPVTWSDRQTIATLLYRIGKDEDVRDYYWRSVPNRPKQSTGGEWQAAFLYLAMIDLGKGEPGKVTRGKVAGLCGMSDARVDHAVRDYRAAVGQFIEAAKTKGPEVLERLVEMYTGLAVGREK